MIAALNFPDIDPNLISFEIFGITLALRWYALAYIGGLILAWRIVRGLMARPGLWANNTPPMDTRAPEDLLTYMILGVILGGRLGFVIFYRPAHYVENPADILKVWEGGMSFHGGFVGVILATLLFCRLRNLPPISVGDAVAFSATQGLFWGRLANFINGELWGRGTTMPWGVIFPDQRAGRCDVWGNQPCARHPSQLYEAALEGLLLFVVMAIAIRFGALKRPGLLIGIFLFGYGAARYFVEFYRQPDLQFAAPDNPTGYAYWIGDFGITMGQALSLPMILCGALVIALALRPK